MFKLPLRMRKEEVVAFNNAAQKFTFDAEDNLSPANNDHLGIGVGQVMSGISVSYAPRSHIYTLNKWLVQEGDVVHAGQEVAEFDTGSIPEIIKSPYDARVYKLVAQIGDVVRPAQCMLIFGHPGDGVSGRDGPKIKMRSPALRHELMAQLVKSMNAWQLKPK